jgi:hypothetical protein
VKTSTKICLALAVACMALASGGAFAAVTPDFASTFTSTFGLDPSTAIGAGAGAGAAFAALPFGTTFTETNHNGEHLIWEPESTYARDVITIASTYNVPAGTVLGKIRGAVSTAAVGTNTGTGSIGTVTAGAGALEGDYKLTIIEAAANAGNFVLENPLGAIVGHGTVAVAFSGGGLSFTLADATDFAAGDTIKITVAAGTKYGPFDPAATDGREAAVAIAFADCDATSADTSAVAHTRSCEVASSKLTWGATANTNQKAAALAQLAALGIIAR